jgi:hypothetical protein
MDKMMVMANKPKNLAQLKRYLCVGVKLKLVERNGSKCSLDREVMNVQGNGVWFLGYALTSCNTKERIWYDFNLAKNYTFTEKGFVDEDASSRLVFEYC